MRLSHNIYNETDQRLIARLKYFSKASAGLLALGGLIVLFGWWFDLPLLKSIHPGFVSMKANTALAFLLAGTALWLLQADKNEQPKGYKLHLAQALAALVLLIGLATFIEYLFGVNFGIDQLLFRDAVGSVGTLSPGRMAANSAFNFILIGLALLLLDVRSVSGLCPSQYLILVEGFIALLALIGYLFGVGSFYGYFAYTETAIHAAILFGVCFFGVLFARPDRGLMILPTSTSIGGQVFRRLFVVSVLGLLLLGWLRIQGESFGWYDSRLGASLYALVSIFFSGGLIWVTANLLHAQDLRRIEYEYALQKAKEEVESSGRLKELLLDILRHDLLGPAGVVKTSLDMVLLKEMPPENRLKFLQLAETSNTKVIEMIESAKVYAKVASAESLPKEPLDLNEIFQNVADSFKVLLLERKIVLNYLPQREKKAVLNPMIENVFTNLLSNAIKYSPEGSKIEVDIVDKGPNWLVYVKDWGDGITDADKPTLFNRFKRVDKKGVKGTGLGLAIVKRIVELHSGRVWIENNPEGGSIFYVEFSKV